VEGAVWFRIESAAAVCFCGEVVYASGSVGLPTASVLISRRLGLFTRVCGAVLTWRSTRRSGTSHISATPTYTARAIQRWANDNPIPRQ
jgi:hypothetical protein